MTDDTAALRDEVALLRRSLDDARAEHARGELDDAGLARIEGRDGDRLAAATARLAAAPPTAGHDSPRATPRSRRSAGTLVAVALGLCVVAAAVVIASRPSSAPTVTHLTTAAKIRVLLVEAELDVAAKHPLRALTAYDAVLALDPANAEALAESGWTRYQYALGAHDQAGIALGAATLHRAVVVAPNEAAGHLYYGMVLLQHFHDRRAALAQMWRAAALPESALEQSLTAQFIRYAQRR